MTALTQKAEVHGTKRTNYGFARVNAIDPVNWLRRGWADFRSIPALSVMYGVVFAGLCAGIYLVSRSMPWYTLGFLTGLVVIGPFLAAGLYVASRDLQANRKPGVIRSLKLLASRRTYLGMFSLMLALIMAAWVRFSALILAIKFDTLSPSIEAYTNMFNSADGWITLGYFGAIGLLLVIVVFTISAIAIPLIIDKDADFMSAIQASYRAVTGNVAAMAIWAVLIVALTAVGIATAFIGLAVVFPILGYATWHSYRDLVVENS